MQLNINTLLAAAVEMATPIKVRILFLEISWFVLRWRIYNLRWVAN